MLVAVMTIALVALTPVNPVLSGPGPVRLGGGGPDAYGYRYLDSDTVCPGAPTYTWVSIKGVGTRITGLGDDNVVGPFGLGFDFPYYWYRANSVFVGSNGYMCFGDRGLNASPFPAVPSPSGTNNTVAILMSDLDPSSGGSPQGSVWYWTNAAADTFILEYDSVRFWSTGGNNSFQIILSKPDSSITFQYKEQSGMPYQGWAPTNNQTGIENVSGAVGLNYLSGTIPPGNMYHAELAVRFFPPESTSYQVHDVGVRNAMNDRSGGMFCVNNRPLTMWAVVKNFGNQSEAQFKTYFKVKRPTGAVLFTDSVVAQALAPSEVDSVVAPNTWTPTSTGPFVIEVATLLTGDMMRRNDSARVECRVVTIPATLGYDGGTPNSYMSWNGPGGFGNRFEPPVYPCSVMSYRIYSQATTSTQALLCLFDDNGPGGSPGDTLHSGTITVTAPQWYTVTPPSPVVINDGAFFVGAMSAISSAPSFGMDSILPLSFQGWEYTGVWAPSRDAAARDVVANAIVQGPVGLMELALVPAPVPVRIDVSPNPFGTSARVRLLNPRGSEQSIELFDAAGNSLRTVELVRGTARLDRRGLADGIYFARVTGAEAPVAKVVVTR